jgi:neuron navigator 2
MYPFPLQEYVFRVDPLTSLGLNSDSIVSYRMGDVVRAHASELPEMLPCGYLVGDNNVISVNLKGTRMAQTNGMMHFTVSIVVCFMYYCTSYILLRT